MIEMTEAQSWVLIGIFATVVIGMMSWQTIHLSNLFRAELGKTAAELEGRLGKASAELEGRLGAQLAVLDRDVQALTRKVFGDDSP
jgi:hypothetical protein